MKLKQQNHICAFLGLGLLIFLSLFCARGETAPFPFSKTILIAAAGEFSLPDRPTAPVPPTRPGEQKAKEKDAPQKPPAKAPAPPPKAVEKQAVKEEKPPPKDPATPQPQTTQPQRTQPDKAPAIGVDEDEPPERVQTKTPEEKEAPFLQAFIKNSLYAIALLSVIALTLYLYFTTPKEPKTKKRPPASKNATSIAQPTRIPNEKAAATTGLDKVKITNKSLLEQLIKYDMETYGEIRSNLDYEQPAYVERLIRKYGGDDKNIINRAIHLFYANRDKK